jgi:hypothetical protein
MARGGHRLPKVLSGPVMPYLCMPCEWATPKTSLRTFEGWPARKAGGQRASFTPLDTPYCTPMIKREKQGVDCSRLGEE